MNHTYNFCPICKHPMQVIDMGYNGCTSNECSFIQYENPTPVVAAVIEYDQDHVLLAHNKSWPPGWFGLITGFVEKNEHPEETLFREVKEETGLESEASQFIGHYMFKRMNQLIMAYHIQASGTIILNDELDDYRIIPFEKAKYWSAGTGYALRDFLQGRGFKPELINF